MPCSDALPWGTFLRHDTHPLHRVLPTLHITDKTIIVWHLTRKEGAYGVAKRALKGHSHFVSDVVISSDGQFALYVLLDSLGPFFSTQICEQVWWDAGQVQCVFFDIMYASALIGTCGTVNMCSEICVRVACGVVVVVCRQPLAST